MPKIGFDCLPPYKYPAWESFEADLAELARLGYDGVELSVSDPARLDIPRLQRSLHRYGLALCGILTGDSYDEEGLCLNSPDPAMRARAIDRLKAHVDWIATFGAVIVVGRLQGLKSDEPDRATANARLVEGMRQVTRHAEAREVRLVLEAVNRFEVNHNYTAAEVLEVVEAVDSPAFEVMLDTFHINIEEASLDAPVRLAGSRLGYMHVAENHRGLVGTGHLDLERILRATLEIGYHGYWTFVDFSSASLPVRAAAAMNFVRSVKW
jgi:D-psicose/D-tagatose/L-ribulose 3-epimerase